MEKTFNYMLEKPSREEFYNVGVHNKNMDLIDEALINLEGKKVNNEEYEGTKARVKDLEDTRALKNGNELEDFNIKILNASEVLVNRGSVYHTGRKPSKVDVGLGSVDNYPSSDKHDVLDGTGNKFVLQKAIKAFYDKHIVLGNRVTTLEGNRAMKNGSNQEDFNVKELNAQEVKINNSLVYHVGRKPSKGDVGLGSVDNYPSSDKHDVLDGTGNKFVLQKAIKAFYDKHIALGNRVGTLEGNRAMKNGSNQEDFNVKELNALEVKINNNLVYHVGRKPSKGDVGLGSVDDYPSSDKYDVLDGTGNKFVLQKAIKGFYDRFVSLGNRVSTVEDNRAMKNGSNQEDFNTKVLYASEVKVNNQNVYHTGRKPNKGDVGLGSVDNYPSSDKYDILDGTGDKFALQKGLKALYDRLKQDIENVSVIGEPIMSLCENLPNTEDFGWCDGGQLRKSEYPRLWERVEATVNLAAQKVTSGELQYGVNYFGWYIGDTSEFFRKPNLNTPGYFMRPSGSRIVGHYEEDSFKSHKHSAIISSVAGHTHTGKTNLDGSHEHSIFFYVDGDSGSHGRIGLVDFNFDGYSTTVKTNKDAPHQHAFSTSSNGGHNHDASIGFEGKNETKPKNIAVKYYCRIK